MSRIIFILALFFCSTFTKGLAQAIPVHPLEVSPYDHVAHITPQANGFYWLGNSAGLHRFDGTQTKSYVIQEEGSEIIHDQFVSSPLFQGEDGQFWFTTYQAFHAFNPQTEQFSTFQLQREEHTLSRDYKAFYIDIERNEILLKADTAIYAFHTENHSYRLLLDGVQSNSIHTIEEKEEVHFFGAPWWNAIGIEYFNYTLGGITKFKRVDLPIIVKNIESISTDSLYLSTAQGLQLLVNPLDVKTQKLRTILTGNALSVAYNAANNLLYASFEDSGLYELTAKESIVTRHWPPEYLSSGLPATLTLTPDASLLISYQVGGVDLLPNISDNISSVSIGKDLSISDMTQLGSGELLIVSEDGAFHFTEKGKHLTKITTIEGSERSKLCLVPNNTIHARGMANVVTFDNTGTVESILSTETCIYRGIMVNQNELVVLHQEGIYTVTPNGDFNVLDSLPNGNHHYFSRLLKISEDRFLASYREVELWDIRRSPTAWNVTAKSPMPGETQAALVRNDTIFAGTSAGLLTIVNNKIVSTFNPSSFGNLWINALHFDYKNRLWLGTEQGLFCYFPSTKEYRYFGKSDGLEEERFIRANVIADEKGFTMATAHSLVRVNPQIADKPLAENKIYLSDIWIDGIRKKNHSLYHPEPIDINYQQNAIAVLPGMIELLPSDLSGFEYQLIGLEENANYIKSGEVIRYPSIPPGKYTFELIGINKNGLKTTPLQLPVWIAPPFYQTWWFWILCGSALLLLFYAYNRWSVAQETVRQQAILKEQKRKDAEILARHQAVVSEQRRIMMELHDDLGGTLGDLFYTLDGYLLDKESGLAVNPDLELLKATSSSALKQLREVMKNNMARPMPLHILIQTITEQARQLANNSQLEWKLNKSPVFPKRELSSQMAHNLLLIVKEALHNIRKHAQANSFELDIHFSDSTNILSLSLSDDGVGCSNAESSIRKDGTGNGLKNMYRRAQDLGAKLAITSPDTGGTHLTLVIPIKP